MQEFKFLVGTTVWNKRISLLQNRMNRKYYIYYFWWLIPVLLPILSPSLNVLSSCVCLITYLMTSTLGWLCIPTLCNPTKLQVSKNSLHSLQFYYNPGCKLKVQMHLSGTVSGLTVFSPPHESYTPRLLQLDFFSCLPLLIFWGCTAHHAETCFVGAEILFYACQPLFCRFTQRNRIHYTHVLHTLYVVVF